MGAKKIQPAKVKEINELKERFSSGKDYVFTNYRGLTVQQISDLRSRLRPLGADFKVVKNTFARLVIQDMKLPQVDSFLVGPTAVAICKTESGPVAKVLLDFAKEIPALEVKAGIIEGGVFNAKQVEAYSNLPSKQQLLAMLMGTMKAPVQNLASGLSGVIAKLARTLQAVADKKANG